MIWVILYLIAGYIVAFIAGLTGAVCTDDAANGALATVFWPLTIGAILAHWAWDL